MTFLLFLRNRHTEVSTRSFKGTGVQLMKEKLDWLTQVWTEHASCCLFSCSDIILCLYNDIIQCASLYEILQSERYRFVSPLRVKLFFLILWGYSLYSWYTHEPQTLLAFTMTTMELLLPLQISVFKRLVTWAHDALYIKVQIHHWLMLHLYGGFHIVYSLHDMV